jgi:hypothetical protein
MTKAQKRNFLEVHTEWQYRGRESYHQHHQYAEINPAGRMRANALSPS